MKTKMLGASLLLVVLASCGYQPPPGNPPPRYTYPTFTTPTTVPTTLPTTTPPTTHTVPPPPPVVRACRANQLVADVNPGDSPAGHIGLRLIFTNTSGTTCTLLGHPTVSFVGTNGSKVNSSAHAAPGTLARITVRPGGHAHADLLLVNVDNFPRNLCKPVDTIGFHLFVPGDSNQLFANSAQRACSIAGVGLAEVSPFGRGQ